MTPISGTFGLYLGILIAFVLCHLEVDIGLDLCLFFKEGLHGTHCGFLHKVPLQAVVGQIVGETGEYHALVVGVVGLHRHMVFLVVALEESEAAVGAFNFVRCRVHAQILEPLQVVVYSLVVDANGHQGAVGRHHNAVGCGVLEFQIGDAKGVVFVVLGIV